MIHPGVLGVHGRVYHRMLPNIRSPLHFFSHDQLHDLADHPSLNREDIAKAANWLIQNNPLYKLFYKCHDATTPIVTIHTKFSDTALSVILPMENFADADPSEYYTMDVDTDTPLIVPILTPLYDVLAYPLLFPEGKTPLNKPNVFNYVRPFIRQFLTTKSRRLLFKRLSEEFVLVTWLRTLQNDIQFLKHHQNIDGHFRLPASFTFSHLWKREKLEEVRLFS